MSALFHLAFPVDDLDAARSFYGATLGCREGRSDERWVDFDFRGHQITAHLAPRAPEAANDVDDHAVPIPHFGLIVDMSAWEDLRDRLVGAGTAFIIEPYVRFAGEVGEQATMFLRDPAGNAIEFKAFADLESLYERSLP